MDSAAELKLRKEIEASGQLNSEWALWQTAAMFDPDLFHKYVALISKGYSFPKSWSTMPRLLSTKLITK